MGKIYDFKIKTREGTDMIAKISTSCKEDGDIKWNFTKFLVDRAGNVVKRFAPTTDPAKIEEHIKELL